MGVLQEFIVRAQELRKVLVAERDKLDDLGAGPSADVRAQLKPQLDALHGLRQHVSAAILKCTRLELAATEQIAGRTPPVGPAKAEVREHVPSPVARAAYLKDCGCGRYTEPVVRQPDAPEREAATRAMEAEPEAQRGVYVSAQVVDGRLVVEHGPEAEKAARERFQATQEAYKKS